MESKKKNQNGSEEPREDRNKDADVVTGLEDIGSGKGKLE